MSEPGPRAVSRAAPARQAGAGAAQQQHPSPPPPLPPQLPRQRSGAAPVTVTSRCQGCGACLLTCPTHAIRPHGRTLLVRSDLCNGCYECLEVCPVDAVDAIDEAPLIAVEGI